MTNPTTRRCVLGGVVASMAATAVPPLPVSAGVPDTALLRLIAEFHTAHTEATAAHDNWVSEQERVEALPDCPPLVEPVFLRKNHKRHWAFLKEHGVDVLCDRSTELWRHAGALAKEIFSTPAATLNDAVEKLKIVRLARGDDDETADINLEAYQYDSDERWFTNVMRDFDRLSDGRVS